MPLHQKIRLVSRSIDYELIGFRDLLQTFEVALIDPFAKMHVNLSKLLGGATFSR